MLGLRARSILKRNYSNISKMSKLILYGDDASPPVRFVKITAALLGVDLHFHSIDLFRGDHMTEFYKKINPLQKVPAISIDGNLICDSHAISMFLCRKYDHQHLLYPKNQILQAKVDQWLYYNATTLFPIDSDIYKDFFAGKWPVDESKVNKYYAALDHLENQLNRHEWLSGDKMQLCDICCSVTICSVEILFPPIERHVKVKEWLVKLNKMSSFEVNKRGVKRLRMYVDQRQSAFTKTDIVC